MCVLTCGNGTNSGNSENKGETRENAEINKETKKNREIYSTNVVMAIKRETKKILDKLKNVGKLVEHISDKVSTLLTKGETNNDRTYKNRFKHFQNLKMNDGMNKTI